MYEINREYIILCSENSSTYSFIISRVDKSKEIINYSTRFGVKPVLLLRMASLPRFRVNSNWQLRLS